MKILILSRYSSKGASSRLRLFQYIPYLESKGCVIKISPLLDDDYLKCIYAGKRYSSLKLVFSYLKRFLLILSSCKYDLIFFDKELFPWLPAWGERFLKLFRRPYIVDYDDATFHSYDKNKNPYIRGLLKSKIAAVMKCSSVVIAGNDYIGEYAKRAGARDIYFFPTVIDLERYRLIEKTKRECFTVGWIGSPSTTKYLKIIENALEEVAKKIPLKVELIGAGEIDLQGINVMRRSWSEETEVKDIQSFDVGIMPLIDDPWERGKCGYKIIQYMACGIPVIASPVGVNTLIVDQGVNGFLASSNEDWINYLLILADDPVKRSEFGKQGRKKVEAEFCLQVTEPKLWDVIQLVARKE